MPRTLNDESAPGGQTRGAESHVPHVQERNKTDDRNDNTPPRHREGSHTGFRDSVRPEPGSSGSGYCGEDYCGSARVPGRVGGGDLEGCGAVKLPSWLSYRTLRVVFIVAAFAVVAFLAWLSGEHRLSWWWLIPAGVCAVVVFVLLLYPGQDDRRSQ